MNQLQQRFLDQLRSQQQSLQALLIEVLFGDQEGTAKQPEVVPYDPRVNLLPGELPETTATLLKRTANGRVMTPALGMTIDRYVQNNQRFTYGNLFQYLKEQGYEGLNRHTIKYHLDKMRAAGKLDYVGPGTKGFYEYRENGSPAISISKLRKTKSKVQSSRRWKFADLKAEVLKFALVHNGKFNRYDFMEEYKRRFNGEQLAARQIDPGISEMKVKYRYLKQIGTGEYVLTADGRKEAEAIVGPQAPAVEQVNGSKNGHSELWNDIVKFAQENNGEVRLNDYHSLAQQRLGKPIQLGSVTSTIGQLSNYKVIEKVGPRHYRLR